MKTGKPQNKKPDVDLPWAKRIQREVVGWMWVVLIFLLVNGTLGQARVIPSGSMENTLLIGDHLIMSRIGYDAGVPFTHLHLSLWRNPKRGQLVIFTPFVPQETSDIVKRVIGLPGETVDIHEGSVWINGQKLSENYTTGLRAAQKHYRHSGDDLHVSGCITGGLGIGTTPRALPCVRECRASSGRDSLEAAFHDILNARLDYDS
jgi:signal peptidase I